LPRVGGVVRKGGRAVRVPDGQISGVRSWRVLS